MGNTWNMLGFLSGDALIALRVGAGRCRWGMLRLSWLLILLDVVLSEMVGWLCTILENGKRLF